MKAFLRPQASLRPYATLEGENPASGRPRSLTDLSPAVEAPKMSACSHTRCSYPCFSRSSSSLAFFNRWRFSHLQEKHKGIHKTVSLTWQELPVLKKQQSNRVSTRGGYSNFLIGCRKNQNQDYHNDQSVITSHLIGWEGGASFLNQSPSEEAIPDYRQH